MSVGEVPQEASGTVIVVRRPVLTGGALPGLHGERFATAEGHGGLSLRALCFHRLTSPHNEAVTSY